MHRDADCQRLAGKLAEGGQQLRQQGWLCLDRSLGDAWATSLACECERLRADGLLSAHTFEFESEDGERHTYEHDGRSYIDLDPSRVKGEHNLTAVSPQLLEFASRHTEVVAKELAKQLPWLDLDLDSSNFQVKLQLTTGRHGCAPCHYDTSPSAPNRQLTLLLYLSRDWTAECGGELLLQPSLVEAPTTLAPLFDRSVLFLSDRVLHRSLPPLGRGLEKHRWLLTVWLPGLSVDEVHQAGLWPPPLQRLMAPAVHSQSYVQALEQSLPPGPPRQALLRAQLKEIASLEEDDDLAPLLSALRQMVAAVKGSKRQLSEVEAVAGKQQKRPR